MSEDESLYKEAVSRMHDYSLLHWYTRLDTETRHRLLNIANREHRLVASRRAAKGEHPLFVTDTLGAALMMLIASGVYRTEAATVQRTLSADIEDKCKRFFTTESTTDDYPFYCKHRHSA